MAKSTADLVVVIQPLLQESVRQILPKDDFVSSLARGFKGLRIGFLSPKEWHFLPKVQKPVESATEQMNKTYMDAMTKIEEAGAYIQYPVSIPLPSELFIGSELAISTIISHEYGNNVKEYLEALAYSEVHDLEDIIAFNIEHAYKELPEEFPDQSRLLRALQKSAERRNNRASQSPLPRHCT